MLETLRKQVWQANLDLYRSGLVVLTWGNVSGIDRKRGLVAIKPSGVSYDRLRPEHLVLIDLSGRVIEGKLNPSSDTGTHLELYRRFPEIGGVAHTHSAYASAFAQACREIPCLGTTHADQFYGPVPVTRCLTRAEVLDDYVGNTGKVIVERFRRGKIKPLEMPAVVVAYHGPVTWGKSAADAVYNSIALEAVAKMALGTFLLKGRGVCPSHILDKHYQRKHGPKATYGQR